MASKARKLARMLVLDDGKPDIGETLPSQSGKSGKFLSTDGSQANWASVVTSVNGQSGDVIIKDPLVILEVIAENDTVLYTEGAGLYLAVKPSGVYDFRVVVTTSFDPTPDTYVLRVRSGGITLAEAPLTVVSPVAASGSIPVSALSSSIEGSVDLVIVETAADETQSSSFTFVPRLHPNILSATPQDGAEWYRPSVPATIQLVLNGAIPSAAFPSTVQISSSVGTGTATVNYVSSSDETKTTTVKILVPRSIANATQNGAFTSVNAGMSFNGSTPIRTIAVNTGQWGIGTTSGSVQSSFPGDGQSRDYYGGYVSTSNPYSAEFLRIDYSFSYSTEECCDTASFYIPEGNGVGGYKGGGSGSGSVAVSGAFDHRGRVNYTTDGSVNGGYGGSLSYNLVKVA